MAQWMDRGVIGYTHMGGEGVNWIGESRFSKTTHAFQQLGDGTYTHSGAQAIRAAVAANAHWKSHRPYQYPVPSLKSS